MTFRPRWKRTHRVPPISSFGPPVIPAKRRKAPRRVGTSGAAAMREHGIAYLKGDWTTQDLQITAFLRTFGRDGLPFYVFYPAGGSEPIILPSVLTEGIVATALRGRTSS